MCCGASQFGGQTVFCGEHLLAVRRICVLWETLCYGFSLCFCGVTLLDLSNICVLWGKSASSWVGVGVME